MIGDDRLVINILCGEISKKGPNITIFAANLNFYNGLKSPQMMIVLYFDIS